MFDKTRVLRLRLRLELKNLKGYYWIPVIILWGVVPLLAVSYRRMGGDSAYYLMIDYCQQFVTLTSPLWINMIGKDFYHSQGRELVFLYNDKFDNLLSRALLLWTWHLLHLCCLIIGLSFILREAMLDLFMVLTVQSLFIIAVSYCVMTLGHNTFFSLVIPILYGVFFSLVFNHTQFTIYEFTGEMGNCSQLSKRAIILAVSVVLYSISYHFEKRNHPF